MVHNGYYSFNIFPFLITAMKTLCWSRGHQRKSFVTKYALSWMHISIRLYSTRFGTYCFMILLFILEKVKCYYTSQWLPISPRRKMSTSQFAPDQTLVILSRNWVHARLFEWNFIYNLVRSTVHQSKYLPIVLNGKIHLWTNLAAAFFRPPSKCNSLTLQITAGPPQKLRSIFN